MACCVLAAAVMAVFVAPLVRRRRRADPAAWRLRAGNAGLPTLPGVRAESEEAP
jgi:hypothetical protein